METVERGALPATVLVVEDEAAMADLVRICLEGQGLRVWHAPTLAEARRLVLERPHLVVLDWNLPDGEGVSFLRDLRSDTLLSHIPVVMLTARSLVEEKVAGLDHGADDYITKPFQGPELAARVTALLRRSLRDLGANPLTGLSGNAQIQEDVEGRLARNEPFDAVYCDIDHFKSYNDRHGFARGDDAIKVVARCLLSSAAPGTFVGHIGGDDFVAVTPVGEGEPFAKRVLAAFRSARRNLHDLRDLARDGYESVDRQGNLRSFPLLSLTAAVVSTAVRRIRHYAELAQFAAELKSAARKEGVAIRVEKRRS